MDHIPRKVNHGSWILLKIIQTEIQIQVTSFPSERSAPNRIEATRAHIFIAVASFEMHRLMENLFVTVNNRWPGNIPNELPIADRTDQFAGHFFALHPSGCTRARLSARDFLNWNVYAHAALPRQRRRWWSYWKETFPPPWFSDSGH